MAASEPDEIIVADVKQGYNPPPVRRVERPKLPVPPPGGRVPTLVHIRRTIESSRWIWCFREMGMKVTRARRPIQDGVHPQGPDGPWVIDEWALDDEQPAGGLRAGGRMKV